MHKPAFFPEGFFLFPICYNVVKAGFMVKVFNFEENPTEFSANTYVVGKVGGNCLVIDLGSTDAKIFEYIDTHYEKCLGILLTHAHFDHIRGIPNFLKHYRKKYDIPVYLHEDDAALLNNPKLNSSSEMTGENIQVNLQPTLIKDGENLTFPDLKVQVIHTPFHTQGSVCYLLDEENAIFTGDTLFKGSIGRTDLATSDPAQVKTSLAKLKSLRDWLVVYPGHGSLTHIIEEKKHNPFFQE